MKIIDLGWHSCM